MHLEPSSDFYLPWFKFDVVNFLHLSCFLPYHVCKFSCTKHMIQCFFASIWTIITCGYHRNPYTLDLLINWQKIKGWFPHIQENIFRNQLVPDSLHLPMRSSFWSNCFPCRWCGEFTIFIWLSYILG